MRSGARLNVQRQTILGECDWAARLLQRKPVTPLASSTHTAGVRGDGAKLSWIQCLPHTPFRLFPARTCAGAYGLGLNFLQTAGKLKLNKVVSSRLAFN